MVDLRPVFHVVGWALLVLAALMGLPAIVDVTGGAAGARALVTSVLLTAFAGGAVVLATKNAARAPLGIREAYLLTISIWTVVPLFGALPFWLGAPGLSPVRAYFEGVSGLTSTGATVMSGLDALPPGINLWRGLMNWAGGLGIAFVAMIFLPLMRVGGMQFFRTEGFYTFGKALPRASDIARELLLIYLGLTAACIATFALVGMAPSVAVVYGLSTVSTGGAVPHDSSFSDFHGAGEYFGALFMFLGSLPFVRYLQLAGGNPRPLWRDLQVRSYLAWLLAAVVVVTLWRIVAADMAPEPAFRESLFNLTSIMSSTGAFSGSFPEWGGLPFVIALVLGMIGACAGSTAAGLSVFRVQIALRVLWRQVRRIELPSIVDPVKYDGRPVEDDVIDAVIMFITSFVATLAVLSVTLALLGADLESAIFAAWATLCNIGYGIGAVVDAGGGTFAAFPDAALVVLILAMIMGRLGLVAVLILLLPRFWRA